MTAIKTHNTISSGTIDIMPFNPIAIPKFRAMFPVARLGSEYPKRGFVSQVGYPCPPTVSAQVAKTDHIVSTMNKRRAHHFADQRERNRSEEHTSELQSRLHL